MISRYYNLNIVSGRNASTTPEPIEAWWQRVGEPILKRHYTPAQRSGDSARARFIGDAIDSHVFVRNFDETGQQVDKSEDLALRGFANAVVQKFGRLYTLQIIRWLSYLLSHLADKGAYTDRIDSLLGHGEFFDRFRQEDSVLKSKKVWSVYD